MSFYKCLSTSGLYLPEGPEAVTDSAMRLFYDNIAIETARDFGLEHGVVALARYYRGAGLLRKRRRCFFYEQFARTLVKAVRFLFRSKEQPRVLDLGCGMGTQSLLFAALGASVLAVDRDTEALEVLERRRELYEREYGRPLRLKVHKGDVLEEGWVQEGPFDGVFSLFSFNMMQPSVKILKSLTSACSPGARLVIQDGNRLAVWNRLPGRRRQVLSPPELDCELRRCRWAKVSLEGVVSLPPICWRRSLVRLSARVNEILNGTWVFPISYVAMYELAADFKRFQDR